MAASRHRASKDQPSASSHRRRTAPLSCAECRRLKLKCTRVFPCTSCVKKGCAAICPDGCLTTGKGNRFVLANTGALHEKIDQLSTRVRQLEDALGQVYNSQSSQPHPLLSEELLMIKRPLERGEQVSTPRPERDEVEAAEVIDAFGSLSMSQPGRSTFFGQTANSWYLLQNEEDSNEDGDIETPAPALPAGIQLLSNIFPFATNLGESAADLRTSILNMLPSPSRAQQLVRLYYRHAAWMYTPIHEEEFRDTVYSQIYSGDSIPDFTPIETHRLAVLCMVFALGALLDLERQPHSPEAAQYYGLGRGALSLGCILDEPSIPAIQALILTSHFLFLSNAEAPRWAIMGLAVKLAQSVGLHRDSDKWNLSFEETQKRRSLLWEIYTYDSWQSLTFGRPPSFTMSHVDCQMAYETTQNERGEVEMTFPAWKHRFSSECLSIVHDQAFSARGVSYSTVQKLDKAVRRFYIPPSLTVPGFGGTPEKMESEPSPVELTMQRYITFAIKEITLFYMHRGFFARAMEELSDDPLSSKYAPSVLAAYNSACSFVALIKSLFSQQPELTQRMWFLFTHIFSCTIVLGAIPSKCPSMALAPSALAHLKSAHLLFEQLSENPLAAKVLPLLRKLDGRASSAMADYQSRKSEHVMHPTSPEPVIKTEEDEWATLGGRTRLVFRRSPLVSPSSRVSSLPRSSAVSTVSPPPSETTPPPVVHEQPYYWDTYPVDNATGYSDSTAQTGEWAPDTIMPLPDWQMPMAMETTPQFYSEFDQAAWLKGYYPSQTYQTASALPMETDVSDSWRNFYAQFNQL